MFKLIKSSFSLDLRTLALYRVLMGIIVMLDVLNRVPDLRAFYTDSGLIPRATFVSSMAQPWSFSLHLANGGVGFIAILMLIHFLTGLFMSLGLFSRWATIGAYLLTVSQHNRNWLVNNGGDDLLRSLLFISIFLPLARVFSMDSALTENKLEGEKEHFSTWGLTIYLQAFVVYYFSYLLKISPIWREDYTALAYSLRLDIFATPLTHLFYSSELVSKTMTVFTIWLEFAGPLLLVFCFLAGRRWWIVRLAVIALFYSLHIGIFASMKIGLFPFICMAMWTMFIPGEAWEWMKERLRAKNFHRLTIYYDQHCNFCKKSVLILKEYFLLSEVGVHKAQDFPEILEMMGKGNSWVIVNEDGKRFQHMEAMVELMRHSPLLRYVRWFFATPFMMSFGNHFYRWIASHRPFMSHFTQRLEFRSLKKKFSWMAWPYNILGALVFISLLMWNVISIRSWRVKAPWAQTIVRYLHIYQEWNMFAPYPKLDNIWIEVPGTLTSGQQIDLLTGQSLADPQKDKSFYRAVRNEQWRKFFLNLAGNTTNTKLYGGYLCRKYNEIGERLIPDTTLRYLDVKVMSQLNYPDGMKGPSKSALVWHHYCFDADFKKFVPQKP
jgi:predicted DCC family thiol-disulfide oxidoreductase YuxK